MLVSSARRWAWRALAFAALAGAGSAAAMGQGAGAVGPSELPMVDRLGTDTSTYIYHMGWDQLRPRLRGTTALEVLEDPQVAALFEELRRMTQRPSKQARLYELALESLQTDFVLAGRKAGMPSEFDDLRTAEVMEELEESGIESLQVGFVMPTPERRVRFGELVQRTASAWQVDAESRDDGPGAYIHLGYGPGPIVHWDGQTVRWANCELAGDWALADAPTRPLGESPFFQAAVKPLLAGRSGRPIGLYYYDLRPTWERLRGDPAELGWSRMSWRSLDAVAGATFVEDGGFRNRHYWRIGDRRSGLFAYSENATLNQEWLRRVPADASGFTTGVFDSFSLFESAIMLAATVVGEADEAGEFLPALMILEPVLRPIGHRYLVYRMPGRYGVFPMAGFMPHHNLIMLVEAPDPEAVGTTIAGLAGMTQGAISVVETELQGHKVLEISLFYMTLYVALLKDEVMITAHPQLLKDALENWENPGPSIVDTPAFQQARTYMVEDPCFLMYFPPGGFGRGIYDEYIPQLQELLQLVGTMGRITATWSGSQPGDPSLAFRWSRFPRGRDITRHVDKATILSAHDDGEGVLFDGYAPVLCTPYHWGYVHALTRLAPTQDVPAPLLVGYWLMTAPSAEESEGLPASQPGTRPALEEGEVLIE